MFELLKKYYRMGIYKATDLDKFVQSGAITVAQAGEIKAQQEAVAGGQ